jgi:hypothetical protein
MSITGPSADIIATLTDKARNYIARASLGDVVFQVVGFGLGRGGFTPIDPTQVTPLNTVATELDDKVYPNSTPLTYAAFASTEEPTPTVRVYNCRVDSSPIAGNADYALGEVALYGQVLNSVSNPLENGTIFVYALSHFPCLCKTRRDVLLRRVIVSY